MDIDEHLGEGGGSAVLKRRASAWLAAHGVVTTAVMFALVLAVTVLHTVAAHGHASAAGTAACQDDSASYPQVTDQVASDAVGVFAGDRVVPAECQAKIPACVAVLTPISVSLALDSTVVAELPAPVVGCGTARLVGRSPSPAAVGLSITRVSVLRI